MVVAPVKIVVTCCSDSWISVLGAVKERYWFVACFISWRLCCGNYVFLWLSFFGDDVWIATVVFEVAWIYCFVESLVVLSELNWSVKVSEGCCQITSGIRENFSVLIFNCLRSVTCSSGVKKWRFYFKVWAAAGTLPIELFWTFLCWNWFCPFGRLSRGGDLLAAFAPKITFLCGMGSFTSGLTGSVDKSRSSVFWIFVFFALVLSGIFCLNWSLFNDL